MFQQEQDTFLCTWPPVVHVQSKTTVLGGCPCYKHKVFYTRSQWLQYRSWGGCRSPPRHPYAGSNSPVKDPGASPGRGWPQIRGGRWRWRPRLSSLLDTSGRRLRGLAPICPGPPAPVRSCSTILPYQKALHFSSRNCAMARASSALSSTNLLPAPAKSCNTIILYQQALHSSLRNCVMPRESSAVSSNNLYFMWY